MNIIIRQITNRSIVFYRCKSFFCCFVNWNQIKRRRRRKRFTLLNLLDKDKWPMDHKKSQQHTIEHRIYIHRSTEDYLYIDSLLNYLLVLLFHRAKANLCFVSFFWKEERKYVFNNENASALRWCRWFHNPKTFFSFECI